MPNMASRTYSLLISNRPGSHHAALTYDWYNNGANFFLNFWADLLGGIEKDNVPDQIEYTDRKVSVTCFTLWFTPQKSPHNHAVHPAQLQKRFEKYFGDSTTDPDLQSLFETLTQDQETVWVDRRKCFADLCDTLGMDSNYINSICQHKDFPWSPDKDSAQFIRGRLSEWWGDEDKKSDWFATNVLLEAANKSGRIQENETPIDFLRRVFYLTSNDLYGELKQKFSNGKKKTGSDNKLCRLVKQVTEGVTDEFKEKYENALHEAIHRTREKMTTVVKPWMHNLLLEVEKVIKTPYKTEKNRLIDEVQEMWAMAMRRHRSWRGSMSLHMGLRSAAIQNYDNLVLPEIGELLDDMRHPEQKYYNMRQFKGIGTLIKRWFASDDPHQVLTDFCAESPVVGDTAILRSLADFVANNEVEEKDFQQSISTYLDQENEARRYWEKKTPPLTSFKDAPENPWLSKVFVEDRKSVARKEEFTPRKKPQLLCQPGVVDGHVIVAHAKMWNGTSLVCVPIHLMGWRFNKDIYLDSGMGRANKLTKLLSEDKRSTSFKPDMGFQLMPRNDRWHLNACVKFGVQNYPNKEKLLQTYKEEKGKILSIDLGERNPLTFSILQVDEKGPIRIEKAEDYLNVSVLEYGMLREKQSTGSRVFCRLSDSTSRPPTKEEMFVWDNGNALSGKNFTRLPKTATEVANNLAVFAKAVASNEGLSSELAYSFLKEVYVQFLTNKVGALTLQKMDNFKRVISAYNSYISRQMDRGLIVEAKVEEERANLQKKLNDMRQERVRITVNLILRKAIESGCNLIVMEELTIKSDQEQSKHRNRRTTDWCCRRVLKQLTQSAPEYGIVIRTVNPRGTSTNDFTTGTPKPKFNKCSIESLDSEWNRRNFGIALKPHSGYRRTIIRECLLTKMDQHWCESNVKGLIEALKKEAEDSGSVYVPSEHGHYYHSDLLGWVDSDISAAIHIGLRGMRILFGLMGKDNKKAMHRTHQEWTIITSWGGTSIARKM